MKRVFILLFSFIVFPVFSQFEIQWKLIDSHYLSEGVVVSTYTDAGHPGIDKTGVGNSYAGIQALLTKLGELGGGVLFFSEGHYKVDGKLLILKGVTLRGDWKEPSEGSAITGTISMAYAWAFDPFYASIGRYHPYGKVCPGVVYTIVA
ncbi:MAG: glycoside hydrolase family 55 protein [Bacteroidales bacterium]|jgi:hypothetical protein|nr:glycoside hydrolase family 55 protein [Bacteroidales bacterium]